MDHVLCNESYSNLINQLHPMNSGINLSDHLPISFTLNVSPGCVGHNSKLKCSSPIKKSCNWSKIEQHHIDKYRHLISANLPSLPPDLACCCEPDCSRHTKILDSYSATFVKCLDAASLSIPHHSRPPGCTLAGWNHGPKQLKKQANFWYKVWLNAGCPSNGVLQQIKRKTKLRFKYAVRSIKRRQDHIKRAQLADSLHHRDSRVFWSRVRQISKPKTSKVSSVVDGVCGDDNISELWASKLKYLLNSNSSSSGDLSLTVHSKISSTSLSELSVSDLDVCEVLQRFPLRLCLGAREGPESPPPPIPNS